MVMVILSSALMSGIRVIYPVHFFPEERTASSVQAIVVLSASAFVRLYEPSAALKIKSPLIARTSLPEVAFIDTLLRLSPSTAEPVASTTTFAIAKSEFILNLYAPPSAVLDVAYFQSSERRPATAL